jgi:hypothetical protein
MLKTQVSLVNEAPEHQYKKLKNWGLQPRSSQTYLIYKIGLTLPAKWSVCIEMSKCYGKYYLPTGFCQPTLVLNN